MPDIDPNEYRLVIEGPGLSKFNAEGISETTGKKVRQLVLTLDDIKTKFKKHEVVSTIQCGGNRRGMLDEIKDQVDGFDLDTQVMHE